MVNPNILSVSNPTSDGMITIRLKSGTKVTVPVDAPLVDPYDTKTGKGFMSPNAILRSALSANAKLAYGVLRSYIYHKFGFTFITQATLAKDLSKDARVARKATQELEQCGVIRIVKCKFNKHAKVYFYFMPEAKWKLPNHEDVHPNVQGEKVDVEADADPEDDNGDNFQIQEVQPEPIVDDVETQKQLKEKERLRQLDLDWY